MAADVAQPCSYSSLCHHGRLRRHFGVGIWFAIGLRTRKQPAR